VHLHSLEVRHRDSCTASLVPRASTKDTSVHLAANPAPLRRIIGFHAPTQHERLTLWYIEDVRGVMCLEAMPPSMHGKRRHRSRFREMLSSRNYDASAATW
ncbi:hypothetical protein TcCL_NonESM09700, partial [Trypanosoma cruzi]